MNGLTATGVTVGICAGLWQLVSSHVGLSQGWELLGTIGFVAFCSFYAAGLCKWTVRVLGERNYYRTLLGGSGLARAFLVTVLYSRWLSRHDAVFCQRDELDGDVTGFSGG